MIARKVNAIGGQERSVDQIKAKWQNEVALVKKKLVTSFNKVKNNSTKTGGGQIDECDIYENLSPKEKRIAILIPKESWMGIEDTPNDEVHFKRNDALTFDGDELIPSTSSEMPTLTMPTSESDDFRTKRRQTKRSPPLDSYTELLRTENERLNIEKERLLIEKERLAIERQRLSVESERLASQNLVLLESKKEHACGGYTNLSRENEDSEFSFLQMLSNQ